jgi:hypothetical protein
MVLDFFIWYWINVVSFISCYFINYILILIKLNFYFIILSFYNIFSIIYGIFVDVLYICNYLLLPLIILLLEYVPLDKSDRFLVTRSLQFIFKLFFFIFILFWIFFISSNWSLVASNRCSKVAYFNYSVYFLSIIGKAFFIEKYFCIFYLLI